MPDSNEPSRSLIFARYRLADDGCPNGLDLPPYTEAKSISEVAAECGASMRSAAPVAAESLASVQVSPTVSAEWGRGINPDDARILSAEAVARDERREIEATLQFADQCVADRCSLAMRVGHKSAGAAFVGAMVAARTFFDSSLKKLHQFLHKHPEIRVDRPTRGNRLNVHAADLLVAASPGSDPTALLDDEYAQQMVADAAAREATIKAERRRLRP
jgi:hypothetical protein